ncbi:Fanconi anemia group I protein [Contarinia nasturtii]|uniref:Fanconi anemia group I protein n=1 Tax=Contarinia nasturtii TaxID=265458 RepID=UPI0012D4BB7E|nr:Fanconi anemia group I protein [Contarinia nasturtii]
MSRKSDRSVMSSDNLTKQIIELGQNKEFSQLQELLAKCDTKLLERTIVKRIDRSDATILWNYLLIGCESNSGSMNNTRFSILMAMLQEMNKVEITSKQTFDLITRTFIELPKLRPQELIQLCQYCVDSLRVGDPKCTGWKELFPELLKLLSDMPKIIVQNEVKTGSEFCDSQIKNLLASRWPETVLSSIGAMFLEMPIMKNDKLLILNKLCENLMKLEPQELPTLAFQLFTLSTTPAQLMVPLISLNQYFQKYLYQKQLDQSTDSEPLNFDSIDRFSDNDLLAAQNTILYHLSNCSEYKISEKEMVQQIRTLASNPKYVLTPFMLSALLTICNVSRYLESVRLSVSSTLPFIRTAIQNNEKEMGLCKNSAWFRDTLEYSTVNVHKVYSILVEQSKEDIFTPGLVGMAFVLLKTPHYSNVNILGIHFLEEIVRVRHQLGLGILKNLKEFLFADQDAPQYTECLTKLSISNPMLISEHTGQIKEIIDFFLLIPGHHAMRMMTFIVPLTKSNTQIRDYFIDMLRKAMYQSNMSTRQMAVYGFCLMLKQLRSNSVWRSSARGMSTQLSISGFSVMSQQLQSSGNNPNNAFDMCVLEIIGILRKCFNQTYEIKEILYDGLSNAIQQNSKLMPHIFQFLEWHFRSYFDEVADTIHINFDKAIEINQGDIQIKDHIGKLLQFLTQCFILLEQNGLEFEVTEFKEFFEKILENIHTITLDQIVLDGTITPLKCQIGLQFLNCLESLMYYSLKMHNIDASSVSTIIRLFQHHKMCLDQLHELVAAAKKANRKKNDDGDLSGQLRATVQVNVLKPENVWDLIAVHGFLEALCRRSQSPNLLWNETDFCIYVLNVTRAKVEEMRSAPDYKQIKYSKSNYKYLREISALILKFFVKDLANMLDDFGIEMAHAAVNCFRECISTATALYERKFIEFLKSLVIENVHLKDVNTNLINILQRLIDKIVTSFENNDVEPKHQVMMRHLFQCLEMLYNHIDLTPDEGNDVHKWLTNYCKSHRIELPELNALVHKILFMQRIRTGKGPIFEGISKQIQAKLGQIEEEPNESIDELKSIAEETAETCCIQLCNALRKQIEEIEYFIHKVKSYCAQIKTGGQNEEDRKLCENRMISTERRICSQFIFISRVCIHLGNAMQPVGQCTDNFTKLLIQLYVCLANLTKHFINRQKVSPISYKSTKFDQLVQTIGKKLPLKIYSMINYIEDNIFEREQANENDDGAAKRLKKNDAKNQKARLMRDTKNIPKLIKSIENFNKFVISLSKKTEHDLNKCLHIGTVRDFRIKTKELREAIDKFRDNDDESSGEDEISDSDDDEEIEGEAEIVSVAGTESGLSSATTGSTGSIIQEVNHDASLKTSVMKNLNAINKRANKRKKQPNDSVDEAENNNQNRRKIRKENETVEQKTDVTTTRRSNRRNPTK